MKATLIDEGVISHTDNIRITKSKEFGEQAESVSFTVTLVFRDKKGRRWAIDKTYEEYPELELEDLELEP